MHSLQKKLMKASGLMKKTFFYLFFFKYKIPIKKKFKLNFFKKNIHLIIFINYSFY